MTRAGWFSDARQALASLTEPDPELEFVLDRFEELDQRQVWDEEAARADADYRQIGGLMIDSGPRHAESALLDQDGFIDRSSAHAFLAGYILLHAGEPNLAVQVLQRAAGDAAYREENPSLVYYLARALVEDGQIPEGVQIMRTLYEEERRQRSTHVDPRRFRIGTVKDPNPADHAYEIAAAEFCQLCCARFSVHVASLTHLDLDQLMSRQRLVH